MRLDLSTLGAAKHQALSISACSQSRTIESGATTFRARATRPQPGEPLGSVLSIALTRHRRSAFSQPAPRAAECVSSTFATKALPSPLLAPPPPSHVSALLGFDSHSTDLGPITRGCRKTTHLPDAPRMSPAQWTDDLSTASNGCIHVSHTIGKNPWEAQRISQIHAIHDHLPPDHFHPWLSSCTSYHHAPVIIQDHG